MGVFVKYFDGYEFSERFKISVRNFIKELGYSQVEESMMKACLKIYKPNDALKYFCGICWNLIKQK